MARLVGFHGFEDGAAAPVFRRQGLQVFFQMRFDLAFGLDDEAEVPAIAAKPSRESDRVAAGIPERIQQTGPAVQLLQAFGAPGQVIGLFLRGRQQLRACRLVARDGRLAHVQRLRTDFAGVVDAHQPGGVAPRAIVHRALDFVVAWVPALGDRAPGRRGQGALRFDDEAIQRRILAFDVHSRCSARSSTGCRTGILVPLAR